MFSRAYKRYALATITAVYTMNFVDRGLMSLLLQPIKEDLRLSDTQLGFLTGIAFGLFYATVGLPLARWADRGNRVTITALAIGLWGITVMACLLVTTYLHMVFARIAAAVGEAGCKPPTYSLVGDYFPQPAERNFAMAIYWLGSPLSTLISFMVGGALNELYGWRITFFIMGIPGLLLAVLVKLTVVEPRVQASGERPLEQTLPPMRAVLRAMWNQRSSRHLSVAIILLWTMGLGLQPWYAAFMMRSHGMNSAEIGLWFGTIFGIGGILGVLLGGYVGSRWFAQNERLQMRLTAITVASLVPCFVAFLTVPNKYHALVVLVPLIVVFNFFFAPTYALLQRLVPDDVRATTLAVVMLLANLIGMGIGTQLVGVFSDALAPAVGRDSLRYSMLIMSFVAFWAGYHYWRVGSTVTEDLSRVVHRPASNALSDDGTAPEVA